MRGRFLVLAPAGGLAGCNVSQSALHPQGRHAEQVAELTWVMIGGGFAIFALVLALAATAVFGSPGVRRWIGARAFIIALGGVFPVVTLGALLVYGFLVLRNMDGGEPPELRIEVVGEMWWWRVNYLDESGATRLATANEIVIPVGAQVEFVLKSADVIHSFWAPALGGKLDMIPGRTNAYRLSAFRAGVYRGQCAEYCGAQHAAMSFHVIAMERPEYDAWFARQTAPAPEPLTDETRRGLELFFENGCDACHAVRGTSAAGAFGPDITHVGSRGHIAAGLLPNDADALAAWIGAAQRLKPEAKMPSYELLTPVELRALAAYMGSLK